MPNELRFDVEFLRTQLKVLTDNTSVKYIAVSGTYTYDPDHGTNYWVMNAVAEGYDDSDNKITNPPPVNACIKPCPRT